MIARRGRPCSELRQHSTVSKCKKSGRHVQGGFWELQVATKIWEIQKHRNTDLVVAESGRSKTILNAEMCTLYQTTV
jgi:hypothetical protein